jgi:hypothetical protein
MSFSLSALTARLLERRNATRDQAIHLLAAYGADARRVAVQRQLEANSWSIARYWRHVAADVVRHSRQECGDFALLGTLDAEGIGSAWERHVRAQELATAIEFARTDDIERRAGLAAEESDSGEDAALAGLRKRPASKAFVRISRPQRQEIHAEAAACAADNRIKAFPRRFRQ